MNKVEVGQRWRHYSGKETEVLAIARYEERVGLPPTDRERAMGITHIAVMHIGPCVQDWTDMLLIEGEPAFPGDWKKIE